MSISSIFKLPNYKNKNGQRISMTFTKFSQTNKSRKEKRSDFILSFTVPVNSLPGNQKRHSKLKTPPKKDSNFDLQLDTQNIKLPPLPLFGSNCSCPRRFCDATAEDSSEEDPSTPHPCISGRSSSAVADCLVPNSSEFDIAIRSGAYLYTISATNNAN